MAELNTKTSIVDYLKSIGKPSDYGSRETLYKQSGLEQRLGAFAGSPNQNTNLLNFLQQQTNQSTIAVPTPTPPFPTLTYGQPYMGGTVKFDAQTGAPLSQGQTTTVPTPAPVIPTTSGLSAEALEIEQTLGARQSEPTPTYNAADALSALGVKNYTPDELASQALGSSVFKLFQQGQEVTAQGRTAQSEAEKQDLEAKFESNKTQLEQSLAAKGLAFSGIRADQVQNLVNSLASSKLGVDRETAQRLLEQGQGAQEKFYSIATDIAKQAGEGKKEALRILEAQGLTIGLDGKTLVPTLSAERATSAEESRVVRDEIAQARLELSQSKDTFQKEIATARLDLAYEKFKNIEDRLFTNPQFNSGAQKAGLSLQDFRTLTLDTQNFFVNAPQKQIDSLSEELINVETGDTTKEEFDKLVDASKFAPEVTTYLKTRASAVAPAQTKGYWSNLWGAISGK